MAGQSVTGIRLADRYKGEFRNDKRHGRGTYTLASGTSWTCEWHNRDYVEGTSTEH